MLLPLKTITSLPALNAKEYLKHNPLNTNNITTQKWHFLHSIQQTNQNPSKKTNQKFVFSFHPPPPTPPKKKIT